MGQYTISATNSPLPSIVGRATCRDSTGALHAVYARSDGVRIRVYYQKSINNGKVWSGEVLLTTTALKAFGAASIAVDSADNLHVVCKNTTDGRLTYIKYTTGVGWGAVVDFGAAVNGVSNPVIAVGNDDSIYVAYLASPNINQWMWVRSEDGGATWTAEQFVAVGANSYTWVNVASDTYGYIHIITSTPDAADDIEYWRFNLGTDAIDLSYIILNAALTGGLHPDITCTAGGRIIAVWDKGIDINWAYNDVHGVAVNWSVAAVVITGGGAHREQPSIVASADGLYQLVYWANDGGAVHQIWGMTYAGAWGAEAKFTNEAANLNYPRLTGNAYPTTAIFPAGYGYTYAREDGTYVKYDNDTLPSGSDATGGSAVISMMLNEFV